MQLVEQHIIKSTEWYDWCVKAKNLYNQSLYYWRQSIFGNIEYFSEYELLGLFREFKEENFIQLPSHCGQEIIKNLFKNIKSWQRARKEYQKNPSKFLGRPKLQVQKSE
jgi:putative transposase